MSNLESAHQLWASAAAFVETEQPQVIRLLKPRLVLICSPSLDSLVRLHAVVDGGKARIHQCPEERCRYGVAFTASTWQKMKMFSFQLSDDWGMPELHKDLRVEHEDLLRLVPLAYFREVVLRGQRLLSASSSDAWERKQIGASDVVADLLTGEKWLLHWQQQQRRCHQQRQQEHRQQQAAALLEASAQEEALAERRAAIRAEIEEGDRDFDRQFAGKPFEDLLGNYDGRRSKRNL